jgi:hypothetical protein
MSRLSEITKYKNTILAKLITNENIVKALGNIEANFLDVPVIPNPRTLLFKNIFPYAFVPETVEDQQAYITVMFKFKRAKSNYYKIGSIGFYIFAHKDILKTAYPWLRTDYIVNQIDEVFNQSQELGIGSLQFHRMEDVKVSNVHSGCYLEYADLSYN